VNFEIQLEINSFSIAILITIKGNDFICDRISTVKWNDWK